MIILFLSVFNYFARYVGGLFDRHLTCNFGEKGGKSKARGQD